jgi:hypothetical protein
MKRGVGQIISRKNAWILPWLLNRKHRELRNAGVSKEGSHDFALGCVHIVLHEFLWCSHRVEEGIQKHAVMMLATLRQV